MLSFPRQGLYMIQRLGSVDEAKAVCSLDESCYGFQWLTLAQLQAIADTTVQQISSFGMGATSGLSFLDPGAPFVPAQGFADIPPASWGLGGSTWDNLGVVKKISEPHCLLTEFLTFSPQKSSEKSSPGVEMPSPGVEMPLSAAQRHSWLFPRSLI